ncbi:hypothetical protein PSTT_02626 [Puccinia striiformis]|uniref:Uncharacterized protein n=1 Tax=Puccinia striiformis TaxID=27350 RepID=A0A2S4VZ11_9BASI|nr:hypothetical protein PSTT_02626 [Puccinia striiformis]
MDWLEAREKSTAMQSSGNFVSSSTWWSRYWMEPEAGDHAVLKRRHPFASEQVPSRQMCELESRTERSFLACLPDGSGGSNDCIPRAPVGESSGTANPPGHSQQAGR